MPKKIKKWQPDDFELEMNTVWSFPKRGDWATHDAKWRGNWSPYIPRNILLRYSNENDLVLDQFSGGGTTLVEAKLLNRNIIGVDVNDIALARCKEKIEFEHEGVPFEAEKEVRIFYSGVELKQTYKPDFFCYDGIIIELKAVSTIDASHRAQLYNYLKATQCKLGLLINFGNSNGLQVERKVL